MRGHGCVVAGASLREVVFNAIYLQLNANLQLKASGLGEITFLSDGEIEAVLRTRRRSPTSAPGSTGAGVPGAPTTTGRWRVRLRAREGVAR